MKKWLLVTFGLIAAVLLSGCGNKEVNNWDGGKSLNDLYGSISFTFDDLEVLKKELFPVSFEYTVYQKEDWSISDNGEYTYLPWDEYILPIEKNIVSKEIASSEVKNGMIYTMVDARLEGDDMVSILYIHNPETLKYSFATVYAENDTTLYTFNY